MSKWMLKQSDADLDTLKSETGLHSVLVRLFAVRGFRTAKDILDFVHADSCEFADALQFADMPKAVSAAVNAVQKKIPTVVYGDYDADGIMSTVIMLRTFHALGLQAEYYIPNREKEGYGLNCEALKALSDRGIKLVFACDNGISGIEQALYAKELGIDLVILDHHTVMTADGDESQMQVLPDAFAVVDAKRNDCAYPFKQFCAAALCYRFSEALYRALGQDWSDLKEYLLPFATIASICDIVDLIGENRILVRRGLPYISSSLNPGLCALLHAVELDSAIVDVFHIGFIIGPCINAAGRLATADIAVELFMTENHEQASELAHQLFLLNQERRNLTEKGTQQALAILEEQGLANDPVIVLHCPMVEESVAGIIAGRLKEKFCRPAIVMCGDGDVVRGSGRSVEKFDLYSALTDCKEILVAFGGHLQAAGLTIRKDDISEFRRRINESCQLTAEDLDTTYRIDCPLSVIKADLELARALNIFSPIGKGNEQPLFADKGLMLEKISLLGKNGKVIRWQMRHISGVPVEAIDFSGREKLQNFIENEYGASCWESLTCGKNRTLIQLDILYHLSVNYFNDRESAQIQIVDFRPAKRG